MGPVKGHRGVEGRGGVGSGTTHTSPQWKEGREGGWLEGRQNIHPKTCIASCGGSLPKSVQI